MSRSVNSVVKPVGRLASASIRGIPKFSFRKPGDIERAADLLAQGMFGLVHFGNIIGLFCEPSADTVRAMNEFKGSEWFKPVSVTTCVESVPLATDPRAFPAQLPAETSIAVASSLCAYGPVGFIFPASHEIPDHLSVTAKTDNCDLKTVQVIVAGAASSFSDFARAVGDRLPAAYFAATSANVSCHTAGHPQPVHYRMRQALDEFTLRGSERYFVLATADEGQLSTEYPHHDARSTTIVRLSDVSRKGNGEPLVTNDGRHILEVTRWGSMDRDLTEKVIAQHGYGTQFPADRVGKRSYTRSRTYSY